MSETLQLHHAVTPPVLPLPEHVLGKRRVNTVNSDSHRCPATLPADHLLESL